MELSERSFEAVVDLFHQVSGIRFAPDKRQLVAGRLNRLAIEQGAPDLDSYVAQLLQRRDPEAIVKVVDRLTTNETYFFREPRHYDILERLARAPQVDSGHRAYRVWSAASSSGEEAYSAAMVLADVFGFQRWEIVGTDLSSAMVQAARTGLYPLERTRGIPTRALQRYCRRGNGPYEGKLLVSRELRDRVMFEQANLLQPMPAALGRFDVIFLRNVMIYFDTARKQEMIERVLQHLLPGGTLFTGHAETLSGVTTQVRAVQPAVYQRV